MHLVPPIIVVMAKHPLVEQTNTSSLKTLMVAGAPLGKSVTEEAMKKLGVTDIRQCTYIFFNLFKDRYKTTGGQVGSYTYMLHPLNIHATPSQLPYSTP